MITATETPSEIHDEFEDEEHDFVEEHGFDRSVSKYPWKFNNEITAIIEGRSQPATRDDAIKMVKERFGCVFSYLDERYQADKEIEDIARAQSSGHAIDRNVEHQTPDWFKAMQSEFTRQTLWTFISSSSTNPNHELI